ncbi:MAG: arginine deiminase [Firmicutes bacterium]|nr:arginine deiminase [Bacillota bacterium]
MKGIHNFSDIGRLNRVLMHRIGHEVEGIVPDNLEAMLFDDIPYLKAAKKEHDKYVSVLEDNGVEVCYYTDEAAKAVASPEAKAAFISDVLDRSEIKSEELREILTDYLNAKEPLDLVETVITGVKKADVPKTSKETLADVIYASNLYYLDPMPNLYFSKDPAACIGDGICVNHMRMRARRRESLLMEYIYKYNRDFAPEGTNLWYEYDDVESLEGGDIMILNSHTLIIGLSQRTSALGIQRLAKNLLGKSGFDRIIVFDIPKRRAFMHLDTVFTMIDYDKFTIHSEILDAVGIYEIWLDKDGEVRFSTITDTMAEMLKKLLGVPAVKLIHVGGNDSMAAQREQWNDGTNTLCIEPGKIITYDRNYITNTVLESNGLEVIPIPSAELSRGRGGPGCMSCSVNREDL